MCVMKVAMKIFVVAQFLLRFCVFDKDTCLKRVYCTTSSNLINHSTFNSEQNRKTLTSIKNKKHRLPITMTKSKGV